MILMNENYEQQINIVQNGRFIEFHKRNSPIMYKLDLATKHLFRVRKRTGERDPCSMSQTTEWFNACISTENDKIKEMFMYAKAMNTPPEHAAEVVRRFRQEYMNVFEKWASIGIHFQYNNAFGNRSCSDPIETEPNELPTSLKNYATLPEKTWKVRDFKNFCSEGVRIANARYKDNIIKIFEEIIKNPEYENVFMENGENYLHNIDILHPIGKMMEEYNLNPERFLIYINYLHQVEYISLPIFLQQYEEYLEKELWNQNGRKNKMYKFPRYFDSVYAIMMRKEEKIRQLENYNPDEYENGYLEYSDNDFIMRIPKTRADVEDEGEQQRHCIATHFMDYIARGDTAVVFMRRTEEPDKSFITIEIRNNVIRQACVRRNGEVPDEYKPWIRNWARIKNVEIDEDRSWTTHLAFND